MNIIFDVFMNNSTDTTSLSNNEVISIFEDSGRSLWIGTRYGDLNRFDRDNRHFIRYKLNPSHTVLVNCIFEDESKVLFLGTDKGLYFKEKDSPGFQPFNVEQDEDIQITAIASIDTNTLILEEEVRSAEETRIDGLVNQYMGLPPITVTDAYSERSAGGRHDFFSEGDYWWPDPANPDGPYIRRDGVTNPDNFVAHRHAMVRMSRIVGAMTSKWILTGDSTYALEAMQHLKAWFVDDSTKMNPHMLYSQAIMGRYTGRGIGIIDGLHLVEAARSAQIIADAPGINNDDIQAIKEWFRDFLTWISTHEYGIAEMVHPNNHGTTWAVQASAYALLIGDDEMIQFCKTRFKEHLLPAQMAPDGSFPLELNRTKPYGYSLFNLDAMGFLAQILTLAGEENLWFFTLEDGRGLEKGLKFLFPYIKDKSLWPFEQDVLYWDDWPVRQPALVLGGIAYSNADYIDLWKQLEPDPEVNEVQRNLVMRYPLLWLYELIHPQ